MRPIKITEKNRDAIEVALREVNGRSYDHCYTDYREIVQLTVNAQALLAQLLYKKDWPRAQWVETSGGRVANAYKNMRNATQVTLEYRPSGWFLINIEDTRVGTEGGGPGHLYLTPEQDRAAHAKLNASYYLIYQPVLRRQVAA